MSSKTVLITGSSTGIGRAAAFFFQQKGWNVAASMRFPEKETELTKCENVICPKLDVTKPSSIKIAFDEIMQRFGSLDVVVNNAGYSLAGPFEGASEGQIQRQFETNLFGLMRVVKAVLPHFREKHQGTIINVASMGGRVVFPLYSLYHSTKWAVEGFSESLRFELEPLGVRIKIIEPGAIQTDFYGRSNDSTIQQAPDAYQSMYQIGFANMMKTVARGKTPEAVAQVIYKAATDQSAQIRYTVGLDAKALLFFRKFMPDFLYAAVTKSVVFKKRG